MNHVDYLKRLGLQGSRLVSHALVVVGSMTGYWLLQMFREGAAEDDQENRGLHSDGTPTMDNMAHPLWGYFWDDEK